MASERRLEPTIYSDVPHIQIAVRSKDGVQVVDPRGDASKAPVLPVADAPVVYSPNGRFLALAEEDAVVILDVHAANPETYILVRRIARKGVQALAFSPLGNFLLSWEKMSKSADKDKPVPANLLLWQVSTGECVQSWHQREYKLTNWPSVKWTHDEVLFARAVNGEVVFYESATPAADPIKRLRLPNVQSFEIAPTGPPYKVAAFVPMRKELPAQVRVFEYPRFEEDQFTAAKSFYKAESADIRWSPAGQALLILTATETASDTYYGESGLHLLFADGSFQAVVPFGNNVGPVQDAAWSPTGKDFLVLQGRQPAQALVFLANNCTPIYDLGRSTRNTIRYSPHGRFLCLGGFGNLPGEMDFWDLFKKKRIGTCQDVDGAKSFQWAPDGRIFITATLHPWRRVDNGYKVWSYAAELLRRVPIEVAYQVAIRPASSAAEYPDRPQSPRLLDKRRLAEVKEAQAATSKPKQAYVPPHLRNRVAAGAELNSKEKLSKPGADVGPRRLTASDQARITASDRPVGATYSPATDFEQAARARAEKRRQKRARKAEAKQNEQVSDTDPSKPDLAMSQSSEDVKEQEESTETDPTKKAKTLQKKLRQIELLKSKADAGTVLDAAQRAKIATESELREQLAKLTL